MKPIDLIVDFDTQKGNFVLVELCGSKDVAEARAKELHDALPAEKSGSHWPKALSMTHEGFIDFMLQSRLGKLYEILKTIEKRMDDEHRI